MLVMMSSVKLPSVIHTTVISLIFPFCKDGAWQNKTAGRPLAHLNATLCADARIHRSGSELPLEKTTTYLLRSWWPQPLVRQNLFYRCDGVTSRSGTLNQAAAFGINPL